MKKILSMAMVVAMLLLSVAALIPAVSAAEPESRAPRYVAYQTGEEAGGKFTMRLCAVIDDLEEHDEVGFKVTLTRVMNGVQKKATLSVACSHAYESITVEGEKVYATEYGGSYFVALNVTGVPETESIGYEITPFSTKNGQTEYSEAYDFALNKDGWKAEVPAFTTSNSSRVTVKATRAFADGSYQVAAVAAASDLSVLKTDYANYVQTLESKGFTKYAENAIGDKKYVTYKGLTSMVHVYYEDVYNQVIKFSDYYVSGTEKSTLRVLYAPLENMEYPLAPTSDAGVKVTLPSLTLMSMDYSGAGQGNNGMGFVYTMADGSYVIIDGGWRHDTAKLYQFLHDNNEREDGEILIRAWLITHPHEDHYGNFESFADKYADKVTLEYFVANLGGGASVTDHPNQGDVTRIHTALAKFTAVQNTKYIIPQIGQKMYFGDVHFEFLHTQEWLYPGYRMTDGNDYSLVAKVTFEGKTMLMTGDAYPQDISADLVDRYESYLASDYVQTPHHGMGGTDAAFYDAVGAKLAFVTTSASALSTRLESTSDDYTALQHLIKTLKTPYHVADNGYQTIVYGGLDIKYDDVVGDEVNFGDLFG